MAGVMDSKTVEGRVARATAATLAEAMIKLLPDKIEGRIALGALSLVVTTIIKLQADSVTSRQELLQWHMRTVTALLARDTFAKKEGSTDD